MITTKTADKLAATALELTAISDALHEAGHPEAATALSAAAKTVSLSGEVVRTQIARYAEATVYNDPLFE